MGNHRKVPQPAGALEFFWTFFNPALQVPDQSQGGGSPKVVGEDSSKWLGGSEGCGGRNAKMLLAREELWKARSTEYMHTVGILENSIINEAGWLLEML